MLFNTEEKNMMIGAFASSGLQTAFNAYYAMRLAKGVNISTAPNDPAYWLYTSYYYWLPNVEQAISLLGVPALLYYMGKKRSAKLKAMGVGALVFGLSELIGTTALKTAAFASGQMATARYAVVGVR